jgi:hypothetical protein
VLDARDAAITHRDIAAYSALIHPGYNDHGRTKVDMVARMIHLFDRFDRMEMRSFDRTIRLLDDDHAQCMQSYKLRVHADDRWRELTSREELELIRAPSGWKISGGL